MQREQVNQAKQQLIAAAEKLSSAGVMFRGEHANLSARVGDDSMVMTRGGNISHLTMDSFAVVRLDETVVEGEVDPVTAEVIHMHAAVYRAKATVGAVIHNHAPNVTVFAVAKEPLPVAYEPLLRFGVTEPIPVVSWAPRGSQESVSRIVDIVTDRPGVPAVMLANHGVLAFGKDPVQTAQLIATLDEAAELILKARLIGGEKPLPDQALEQVRTRMEQFSSR
ncbi:class II aldolase/adducin family protein [Effusibacillus dendaii]|uniref:Aldolase n=1 Tax=Effusibacillus dendaii TaxID=2743772 RepID=A0A7I8DE34_9BACL|nr:class II aldolase/adducin family protein [Effusibacillus dendaii]BCJ88287.1 aldolase [Effusibacillus dendaii]